ncbi:MAG: energy-coupling factor ABC transporter permease [Candidatus Sumerlaeia bacterium]|nr:energy-coupling factor ABC transporter permease [Candidatus Sumerlaeia bacterium]
MHMADALLSPAVGGAFIAASGATLAFSAYRLGRQPDERRVPLMGVLGAFVFAAQMINFTIPGTGSSGHLGGGMLLAILLGPYAAFLVIASVLVVQSLFFLDGGVLALGTNLFNLGVWPCFLGLLIYRVIVGRSLQGWRMWLGACVAVVVSLELGAAGVVIQTMLSGRTDLPFGRFMALMLGIHFPIGLVEGVVTAAVVQYVWAIRPGVVENGRGLSESAAGRGALAPVVISFLAFAVLTGGVLAWFASEHPDGLEWAVAQVRGGEHTGAESPVPALERLQQKTALMPDYDFPRRGEDPSAPAGVADEAAAAIPVNVGTSVAGLLGAAITLALTTLIAAALYRFRPRSRDVSR